MARQLDLLPSPPVDDDWHLDDRTIEVGLKGIARARAALAEAKARIDRDDPHHGDHHQHGHAA